jgi:hypothetical protein
MTNSDSRFGFSVIGGVGEGLSPRVDDVQPGKHQLSLWQSYYNSTLLLTQSYNINVTVAKG